MELPFYINNYKYIRKKMKNSKFDIIYKKIIAEAMLDEKSNWKSKYPNTFFGEDYNTYNPEEDPHANDIYVITMDWVDDDDEESFKYIPQKYNLKLKNYHESFVGYEVSLKGTKKDIIRFVFEEYDPDHQGEINWEENGTAYYAN